MSVYAVTKARTNAQLVAELVELHYLRRDWRTVDLTYGLGRFWRKWSPDELLRHDIDPKKAPDGPRDFTATGYPDESFDAVVLDGPYKLNGTGGSHASDDAYGVANVSPWQHRHALITAGIVEAARIVRPAWRERVDRGRNELAAGIVLVKCQDQVSSGAVRWQTREFAAAAENAGLELVDALLLPGHRTQPARTRKHGECRGTGLLDGLDDPGAPLELVPCPECSGTGRVPSRQHHAHRNYSTLLVARKAPQ